MSTLVETMTTPLVSVHMITYNHAPYIAQAIEGVLMQDTDFPFELVIGEDCSTDGTRDIIAKYRDKYPEVIRVITSGVNVGAAENNSRTLKACRGKYIAYCEGDDFWHRIDKLQLQVEYLEGHPECGLVCSDYDVFYTADSESKKNFVASLGTAKVNNIEINDIFNGKACIQTVTVVARKSIIDKVKSADPFLYIENNFKMGDTQLWAEISVLSKIYFFQESLATYKILEESATQSKDEAKRLQFWQSGAELCMYMCKKHHLPVYIHDIHEKRWRLISLKLAFLEKNAEMAMELRRQYPKFNIKEYLYYLGSKSVVIRYTVIFLKRLFRSN